MLRFHEKTTQSLLSAMIGYHAVESSDVDYKVIKSKDSVTLYFSVPGLCEDDINVSVSDGKLTISYDGSEGDDDTVSFVPAFKKAFSVKDGVDVGGISAKLQSGLLKVDVPIAHTLTTERKIPIK
jgi:HSP20 family molecular chaperone IbpA